jgi:DNA-directed RNA polymerase specialized sigma24 family protein
MRRAEARRRKREMEFSAMNNASLPTDEDSIWNQTAGVLEDAMDELGNDDRTAILLRFFRRYDFRSIGQALDLSDDGARMPVNRPWRNCGKS